MGTRPLAAVSGVMVMANCDGASGRLCAGCSGGSTAKGEPISADAFRLPSPATYALRAPSQ